MPDTTPTGTDVSRSRDTFSLISVGAPPRGLPCTDARASISSRLAAPSGVVDAGRLRRAALAEAALPAILPSSSCVCKSAAGRPLRFLRSLETACRSRSISRSTERRSFSSEPVASSMSRAASPPGWCSISRRRRWWAAWSRTAAALAFPGSSDRRGVVRPGAGSPSPAIIASTAFAPPYASSACAATRASSALATVSPASVPSAFSAAGTPSAVLLAPAPYGSFPRTGPVLGTLIRSAPAATLPASSASSAPLM